VDTLIDCLIRLGHDVEAEERVARARPLDVLDLNLTPLEQGILMSRDSRVVRLALCTGAEAFVRAPAVAV
jgi:hypothetical protein